MKTSEKLNAIQSVLSDIEDHHTKEEYVNTGRKEPRRRWNPDIREYTEVKDDNGNIIYDEVWEYQPVPVERLTEEEKYIIELWVDIEINFKKEISKILLKEQ